VFERAGREKTNIESKYVQLNPLTDMTAQLFVDTIAQRQAVLKAKEKFQSKSACIGSAISFVATSPLE